MGEKPTFEKDIGVFEKVYKHDQDASRPGRAYMMDGRVLYIAHVINDNDYHS